MTVLVTGATGNVGSAVIRELLQRGTAVRAFVRNAAAELPAGVERAIGDFEDAGSIRAALDGIDGCSSARRADRALWPTRRPSSTPPPGWI